MRSQKISHYVYFLLTFFASASLPALEITIIDSQGKPVSDAVVGIGVADHKNTQASSYEHAIMDQIDYQFVPKTLVIEKNRWVNFPNSDDVRHHIYSFSSPKHFEIKMFASSEAQPVQFNESGIVVLGCNIHDSMVGYIYVTDSRYTAISSIHGKLALDLEDTSLKDLEKSSDGLIIASLWHPLLFSPNTQRIEILIDPRLTQQNIRLDMLQIKKDTKKLNGFSAKFKSGD